MNYPSHVAVTLVAMATISLFGHLSRADVSMTAREVGDDVQFSYSGTIDLTDLGGGGTGSSRGAVYAINSWVGFGPSTQVEDATTFYSAVDSAPANIGAGMFQVPDFFSGNHFSINNNSVAVPVGYASGSPISGSITFANKTLMDLGVDSSGGPYTWALTNDQEITLTFLDAIAAPAPDNSALKMTIKKKIKKLKKQLRSAKKKQKIALQKKLKKKLKRAKSQFKGL